MSAHRRSPPRSAGKSTASSDKWSHRETGFNLSGLERSALPEYNPLFDKNLAGYFANGNIQRTLYRNGMIDREGRVLDGSRSRAKLHLIEKEFKTSSKDEEMQRREEEQRMRRQQLMEEENRKQEERLMRIQKIREEERQRRLLARTREMAKSGMLFGSPSRSMRSKSAPRDRRPMS
jgi:hypothetical protein